VVWYVTIRNRGPGAAYNVSLVTAAINGFTGTPSPSANVGTLARGDSKIIKLTSGNPLNLGENIEIDTVTWAGGKSTVTLEYVAEAGP
jgi:hypothetical protein